METRTKYVIGAVATFQIIGVIVGIVIFILSDKMCLTKECSKLSTMLKDYIDVDINPCKDFYTFSCGKMLSGNDSTRGLMDKAGEVLLDDIYNYLQRTTPSGKPQAFYKARQFYSQCKDAHFTRDDANKRMAELVNDCGGFPARDGAKWDEKSGQLKLEDMLQRLRQQGLSTDVFFSLTYKRDPKHSAKYIMCISKQIPYPMFSRAFLATCISSKCQMAVLSIYSIALVNVGVKKDIVESLAKELFTLDKRIARLSYTKIPPLPHEFKNLTMTVKELQARYNFLNWDKYFKLMFHPNDAGKGLSENTLLVVDDPEYMDEIKLILTNMTIQQQANYLVWYNLMSFLYFPELAGKTNYCFNTFMARTMPEILTALAVRVKNEVVFPAARRVIKNIGDKFISEINRLSWMDKETKKAAIKKINEIEITVGYLEYFGDNELIDAYYNLSPGSKNSPKLSVGKTFYDSYRAVKKFRIYREAYCFSKAMEDRLCKLLVYSELKLFGMNMFYDPLQNQLVVADAALRPPMFSPHWPHYVYYARFGFFVGHELLHMVDDIGRHYNKDGNVTEWWGKQTEDGYKEKLSCFQEQYHRFHFYNGNDRLRLPENTSMNEVIGDNGGLHLAYFTYEKNKWWPSELKLPDVKYDLEQIFFISFAQLFCDDYTEPEHPDAFYNPHAPRPIRVVEAVENSPEFSKAFNCSKQQEMNHWKKCMFF